MLIRSQDKETLINQEAYTVAVNKLSPHQIIAYIPLSTDGEAYIIIGNYATKERAIRVLDEFEKCYANYSRRYGGDCSEYSVFQMPEE